MTVYPYVDSKIPSAEHFMGSGNLRTIFFFFDFEKCFLFFIFFGSETQNF